MSWRRWNHVLHRDIGYLCIGLTLIYGISGIAVNHLSHSFNPSYIIEKLQGKVTPISADQKPDQRYIDDLLQQLAIPEPYKNGAMLAPDTIRVFTETYTIDVNLSSGDAAIEKVKKIPVLYAFNFLHLNKAKGVWTLIADIYAIAIVLLALTGLLMIRGRSKFRGTLLTLAGAILPLLAYLFITT